MAGRFALVFYFNAPCDGKAFERMRAASNMEILMLSGARSAHGNIEEWRGLMRRIDPICEAFFGRTERFQPPDGRQIDAPGPLCHPPKPEDFKLKSCPFHHHPYAFWTRA